MILGDFQNEKLHNVAWVADSFNTLVVDSDRLGSQSVQRLQLCPRDSPSNRPWSASVPVRPVSTAGGMSRRLLLLGVLVSLGALNTEAASTLRSRRQAEVCEEATDSFDECTNAWVDNWDLGQHWWGFRQSLWWLQGSLWGGWWWQTWLDGQEGVQLYDGSCRGVFKIFLFSPKCS